MIDINFTDFWPGFDKQNNYFYNLLRRYYPIRISDKPEFLIYSCFGKEHRNFRNAVKIFYSGENTLPNFYECDYAMSTFYISSPRHIRMPLYNLYFQDKLIELAKSRKFTEDAVKKKYDFCSFVVSNPDCKFRNMFFERLSKYKKVDSGGRYMNNVGIVVKDKLAFLSRHKFDIAFENSECPGYTTEKLVQSYLAGTVPIYWGNRLIGRDFNKKAFICVYDYPTIDALINKIIEIDQDDAKLLSILNQPLFESNEINDYVKEENIVKFFDFVFSRKANKSLILDFTYWKRFYSSVLNLKLFRLKKLLGKIKRALPNVSEKESRNMLI